MPAIVVHGSAGIQRLLAEMSTKLRSGSGQLAFAAASAIEAQTKLNLSGQYLHVGSQKGGKASGRRLRESFTTRALGSTRAVMGTSTTYAPVHEYGYENNAQVVMTHFRRGRRGGKEYKVNTYTRHMRQKERRYLRDAMVQSEASQIRRIMRAYNRLVGQG